MGDAPLSVAGICTYVLAAYLKNSVTRFVEPLRVIAWRVGACDVAMSCPRKKERAGCRARPRCVLLDAMVITCRYACQIRHRGELPILELSSLVIFTKTDVNQLRSMLDVLYYLGKTREVECRSRVRRYTCCSNYSMNHPRERSLVTNR